MSEPLIRRINREQMCWRAVDVEQLIGEDHLARAIWARRRARGERQQRLEQGLEELQKLRPSKPRARVSVSEPEARRMRQSDGGIAPHYNVQIAAGAPPTQVSRSYIS